MLPRSERRGECAQLGLDFLLARADRARPRSRAGTPQRRRLRPAASPIPPTATRFEVEAVLVGRAHAGHAVAFADHDGQHRHASAASRHRPRACLRATSPPLRPRVPTMKPGTSTKKTSGMWNMSHISMKCVCLRAAFTSIAPPYTIGLLAITPTTLPSMRARHVITERAERRLDLEQRLAVDDHRDQLFHVVGLAPSSRHDREQALVAAVDRIVHGSAGGNSHTFCGIYERKRLIAAKQPFHRRRRCRRCRP